MLVLEHPRDRDLRRRGVVPGRDGLHRRDARAAGPRPAASTPSPARRCSRHHGSTSYSRCGTRGCRGTWSAATASPPGMCTSVGQVGDEEVADAPVADEAGLDAAARNRAASRSAARGRASAAGRGRAGRCPGGAGWPRTRRPSPPPSRARGRTLPTRKTSSRRSAIASPTSRSAAAVPVQLAGVDQRHAEVEPATHRGDLLARERLPTPRCQVPCPRTGTGSPEGRRVVRTLVAAGMGSATTPGVGVASGLRVPAVRPTNSSDAGPRACRARAGLRAARGRDPGLADQAGDLGAARDGHGDLANPASASAGETARRRPTGARCSICATSSTPPRRWTSRRSPRRSSPASRRRTSRSRTRPGRRCA